MIAEAFLTCALALPAVSHTHPPIVSWQASESEEEKQLKDWIHKNNPDSDIFIYPNPQEDKLKEYGWERMPFTWRGKQIWIKRKPSNQKMLGTSG